MRLFLISCLLYKRLLARSTEIPAARATGLADERLEATAIDAKMTAGAAR
jgi:hypothetical protein